jgi:ABC-type Na+ efflux pump permease subunit
LQLYSLSAEELEKILVKYSEIEGFDRNEFVYRRLAMFNSELSKQTRKKMKSVALEKYKKELTDAVVEAEKTNDDAEDLPAPTTASQLSPNTSAQPTTQQTMMYFLLLFILLFLVIIVALIYRRKKIK